MGCIKQSNTIKQSNHDKHNNAMGLGVTQGKTYLNIKEGKIVHRNPSGQEALYDFIEGYLVDITTKDRDFKGEPVKYWYIDITDRSGVAYSLALHYTSGVAKSLFNSLASATDFSQEIKIQPYLSGDFTKVVVTQKGERLSWKYPELPPVEEVKVGDKLVKDDSKRMELFTRIVEEIVTKVNTII